MEEAGTANISTWSSKACSEASVWIDLLSDDILELSASVSSADSSTRALESSASDTDNGSLLSLDDEDASLASDERSLVSGVSSCGTLEITAFFSSDTTPLSSPISFLSFAEGISKVSELLEIAF